MASIAKANLVELFVTSMMSTSNFGLGGNNNTSQLTTDNVDDR